MDLAVYKIFTFLFRIAFNFVALWNEKAKKGLRGRVLQKSLFQHASSEKSIWMHCASLGEFEQGRPIVEALKQRYPSNKLIISFFSASGFEASSKYDLADEILYLPFDGKNSSKEFIDYVNPELVIWVKYEYWYWFLTTLKKRNIPVLLVSAHFRKSQPFLKWYGGLYVKMLHCFKEIFIQNKESIQLIKNLLPSDRYVITGDTRFDRVTTLRQQSNPLPDIFRDFVGTSFCVVAGSTWPEDELQIVHFAKEHPDVKIFIVPHEVDKESIAEVKERFLNHSLYSEIIEKSSINFPGNVLIIDTIGMLSRLYQLADIAYIGGGFNESGIHNTLEAAVWGTAIVFGPVYEKFVEARDLVEIGAATSISTPVELDNIFNELLADKILLDKKRQLSKDFVENNQGATSKIIDYIQEKRLLIN